MIELKIEGMGCDKCVTSVKAALEEIGITNAEVGVGYAKFEGDLSAATEAIEDVGFDVVG